ncbi:MAG: M48 family metalloprotease [Methylococcaceae bacterium]
MLSLITRIPSLKRLIITLCLSISLAHAVEIDKMNLPDMGDSSGALFTAAEEKELGEAFFRSLHSQIEISQDSEIQDYIQAIGERLTANSDNPSYPFHFFVVMENDINAFAGPGGYIGVNSGLLLITEAESELASVMAHEIGHITQRHLYRAFEAQQRMSIPSMAAMLAAIALGTQNPAAGQAAIMAAMAVGVQSQIDFTRENEQEADRVGMQTLVGSQFDPRSMPTFFERLQQASRYYGQAVPEFLRTHPVTASRIADTRGRAEGYPYKQFPDSLAYQLVKAKLRVLSSLTNLTETARYFQVRVNQGTAEQRDVANYGLGLVALYQEKFADAEAIFQRLAKDAPNDEHYQSALARTALAAKNFMMAQTRYQRLIAQYPENEAIKLDYIRALLRLGDIEAGQKYLATLSANTQQLPIYWELQAQVYSLLNQPAESHRYLAEYYYSMGDLHDAILQIKLAQQSRSLNFFMTTLLAERLNFFLNQQAQLRSGR